MGRNSHGQISNLLNLALTDGSLRQNVEPRFLQVTAQSITGMNVFLLTDLLLPLCYGSDQTKQIG